MPAEPLRQRRRVEVGVGVLGVQADRLLVGEERLGQSMEVLLGDPEVVRCDGVVRPRGERGLVLRRGLRRVARLELDVIGLSDRSCEAAPLRVLAYAD